MDIFFQRHFRRGLKRQKHPTVVRQSVPAVQASKARRRSSVGLPSVALVQCRRSSVGLPSVYTDQRRRPSVGVLVASGQKRQSIIDLGLANASGAMLESGRGGERGEIAVRRGRRYFQYKPRYARRPSGTISCVHRGLAVRYRRPSKVKSIESHLLGSSMLLASVVQMGREVNEKEEEEEEMETSLCFYSESDGEEGSDEEVTEEENDGTGGKKDADFGSSFHSRLAKGVLLETIKPRPLLRPPRCLRRNSSHLLPVDSVYKCSETVYGVYGRYIPLRLSQTNSIIQTSITSPSLSQLATPGLSSGSGDTQTDLPSPGSPLHKSCSSLPGEPEGTMYYDPYLDTWENFLSYVTHKHT